jgi:hypothetical protein
MAGPSRREQGRQRRQRRQRAQETVESGGAQQEQKQDRNRNEREQGLRDPDSAPDARIRGADAAFTVGHQTGGAAAQWSRQWRECVTAGRGAASL